MNIIPVDPARNVAANDNATHPCGKYAEGLSPATRWDFYVRATKKPGRRSSWRGVAFVARNGAGR